MITVNEIGEGRMFTAPSPQDQKTLIVFMEAVQAFQTSDAPTSKTRSRLQKTWLNVEKNMGKKLPRSNGLNRDDVFEYSSIR